MENRYYGTGKNIENDAGYTVKVGEPVFDDKVTSDEYGEAHILVGDNIAIESDTQYLVTLEVNGTVKMYRELWMSGNADTANEVALSDYTFTMDEGTIGGLTEGDVVIARFEPVELTVSDAFRAAVGKVAPKSEGGSGGGVFVVNGTWDEEGTTCTLDKTWQELYDADFADFHIHTDDGIKDTYILVQAYIAPFGDNPYGCKFVQPLGDETNVMLFLTDTANGYPVYTYEESVDIGDLTPVNPGGGIMN